MQIKKLESVFYTENSHLIEALDKDELNRWSKNKERGYGIVICVHNGLRFGIPLRSHLKNKHGLKTVDGKGLDYSKAVLLDKDLYISAKPFMIPDSEYRFLVSKENVIIHQFSKYVEKYIQACKKGDKNILREYRFSTLQNYHSALKIGE